MPPAHPPASASVATPLPLTKEKTIARPLKYHERPAFLRKESAFDIALGSCLTQDASPSTRSKAAQPSQALPPAPCFLGHDVSESLRLAATLTRSVERAAMRTRPFSWGYSSTDGASAHNNTHRVKSIRNIAFFRRQVVRSVAAGNRLSLFLTDDGKVYQSGRLFMKQDGCGMWAPREQQFPGADDAAQKPTIVAIAAGHLAAYALDELGRVYAWGTQQYGQLGFDSDSAEAADPVDDAVSTDNQRSDSEEDARVNKVSACTESDGDVDDDSASDSPQPLAAVVEQAPRLVAALAHVKVVKICAGNHFALAVSALGHVYSWGRSCYGQLGRGQLSSDSATPARVDALAHLIAVDIAAGDAHALGVFVSRQHLTDASESWTPAAVDYRVVYAWGRGRRGCLGLGGAANEVQPREVRFFRGLNATHVAAGSDHSLVLCRVASQSFAYAFGGNEFGQLGIASTDDHVDMPSYIAEFTNVHIASVGAGARYSVALTGDGELFTWGDATHGKTQRRDKRTAFVPWRVEDVSSSPEYPKNRFVTQIAVGTHHALGLFRISGAMDRWRKFPLGPIASHLDPNEGTRASPACICPSSQSATASAFGIYVACATCKLAPICRRCARQCHANHSLKPAALGRVERREICACSAARSYGSPAQTEALVPTPAPAPSLSCAFAKLEPRILEDELSKFPPRPRV